ncbi:MAG: selenide, water dikinase SelD, partial [Bdellovibrionales bacterium]|nr:selenide, water dikinase SelD [Bdellovibrionales bacterium]
EAGACLAGGHTIDDDTIKLGFSVSGFVAKERAWTNAGARPGDALILTKGLGTGTITSALKKKEAREDWVRGAIDSMMTLNRAADLLGAQGSGRGIEVHAATDITGFGLAGHALQMAQASQCTFRQRMSEAPTLPGALECLRAGVLNRAHRTNAAYAEGKVEFAPGLPEELRWLALDPQTSGGLLLSVPKAQAADAVSRLRERFPRTAVIGEAMQAGPLPLVLES